MLLGALHSPATVGLYRFGNRMATGATDIFSQPMSAFAATQFGAAARCDADLAAPLARFAGTTALLGGLVSATIIVLARDVVLALFHPAYLPALVVAYAMALRSVAGVGQLLVEPAFAALGRTAWVMLFDMVSTAIALAAVFAVSPFGLEALAWAQVAAVLLTTAWAFHLLRARGGIRIGGAVRAFAGAVALSLVYGLLLWLAYRAIPVILPMARIEALGLGLGLAAVLAVSILAIGARLRIFSLQAFAG